MSPKDKIILDLDEKIMVMLKNRTQLIARGAPEASQEFIITDRDKAVLTQFFEDFKVDLLNETGMMGHGDIHEESPLIITLNERQIEQGISKFANKLRQIAEEYLLMRWFDGLNQLELSGYRRAVYEKLLRDFKGNSTNCAFVNPKWRPYW